LRLICASVEQQKLAELFARKKAMSFPPRQRENGWFREIASKGLSIARQFAFPPMRVFAIGIKHPLDAAAQRSHETDAREHHRFAGLQPAPTPLAQAALRD
jgi:hypothetical protein